MSGYLKQGEEKGDSIFTKATNGILRVGTQGMKGRERGKGGSQGKSNVHI